MIHGRFDCNKYRRISTRKCLHFLSVPAASLISVARMTALKQKLLPLKTNTSTIPWQTVWTPVPVFALRSMSGSLSVGSPYILRAAVL